MCRCFLYAFVDAVPFEERQNDFGEAGAQARPPEKDVGAGLDGAAVSSQQQRGTCGSHHPFLAYLAFHAIFFGKASYRYPRIQLQGKPLPSTLSPC